jgi:iron complex transport system substrate-binding protein
MKRPFRILLLFLLAGCHTQPSPTPASPAPGAINTTITGAPITLTDARGKTLTLPELPRRIVSLAPSNTEVLFDLGAGDRIAADTTACDWPPQAKNRPHVGTFDVSLESIEVQNPDLVVAVNAINSRIIGALESAHVPVLVLDPKTVPDTYTAILLLGRAVGEEAKAEKIVADMQKRIRTVQQTVAKAHTRPKVLILYGLNPIYTTGPGSFISDAITTAGGENIADANTISPEKVLERQPDVIICSPGMQERVKQLPGWAAAVPAVRRSAFFVESPSSTLVRPTPRIARGIEELARFLHPELFFGTAPEDAPFTHFPTR